MNADDQRAALAAVLETVDPDTLDLRDDTLALLTPGIGSYLAADGTRELFSQSAYPAFDVVSTADTAAGMTFDVLLDPLRVARLVEFHRRDARQLGADEMFATITKTVMRAPSSSRTTAIAEAVQARYAFGLMDLIDADISAPASAAASAALEAMSDALDGKRSDHAAWLADKIEAFQDRPVVAAKKDVPAGALPPGGPIGMGDYETCWHCDPL